MFTNNSTPFTMPVAPVGNAGYGGGGFGYDGGSWVWFILILLIFGWGNNGAWGNGGGYGISENYTLVSDMSQLERKIDGVYSGICDSTFALNNTITNGFSAAQNTMTQGFAGLNTALVQQGYEARNAIQQDTIAGMQNTNAIQAQLAQCCCDNKAATADLKYDLATHSCATNTNIATAARDIVDSQNAGTRAILDALAAQAVEAKNEKIAEQNQRIFQLELASSQAAQNNYLINHLRPAPSPAYVVPNPYCNCNCNNGSYYGGTTIA